MSAAAVTTFSQEGYRVYGKWFIDAFVEFWPEHIKLHVFYEGELPEDANPKCIWHSLDLDPDRKKFIETHKDGDTKDYRKCPVRFSHKVFAVTSKVITGVQHIMWIDADCETFRNVWDWDISHLCAEPGQVGSYLARPYHRHSETGFWTVNLNAGGREFLDELRRMYTSDDLLLLSEWHDSMAFDYVVRKFERAGYRFKNLCKGARGLDVFEQSPLGGFIKHNKGPAAKREVYGNTAIEMGAA